MPENADDKWFLSIMESPEDYFESPETVAQDKRLSTMQKIAVLRNWEWDIHELMVAEEENMVSTVGPYSDLLSDIHMTLDRLAR